LEEIILSKISFTANFLAAEIFADLACFERFFFALKVLIAPWFTPRFTQTNHNIEANTAQNSIKEEPPFLYFAAMLSAYSQWT
jgi:hypothetical protein